MTTTTSTTKTSTDNGEILIKRAYGCEVWRTEEVDSDRQTALQKSQADHWFAWQKLNGVTRNLIKRVHKVPEQFLDSIVAIQKNHPYLGGMSLTKHGENGTLYVVDLTEVTLNEETLVAPMALFVVSNKKLMPVAIKLDIRHPSRKVFTPSLLGNVEDLREWVKARMWFNMIDAQYHESITHLGFTHLIMDGVSVCMHRNLSARHPIYKLLLPHFQYMHNINKDAQKDVISPGGFVDKNMYFGHMHMVKLLSIHNRNWTFTDMCLETSLHTREANEIPGYFFKDDALHILKAIRRFVTEYVKHYYKTDQNVRNDREIQAFRAELTLPRSMNEGGGCGINGIPEFDNMQNIVDVLSNFIYTCSVEHSAANFPQYDEYVFPPNFAATLHGNPEAKTTSLDDAMPTGKEMFGTIKVIKMLTLALTNSLGNYKWYYLNQMDDDGRTFVQNFRNELATIQEEIILRNKTVEESNTENQVKEYPYEWLLPDRVLNSISS